MCEKIWNTDGRDIPIGAGEERLMSNFTGRKCSPTNILHILIMAEIPASTAKSCISAGSAWLSSCSDISEPSRPLDVTNALLIMAA